MLCDAAKKKSRGLGGRSRWLAGDLVDIPWFFMGKLPTGSVKCMFRPNMTSVAGRTTLHMVANGTGSWFQNWNWFILIHLDFRRSNLEIGSWVGPSSPYVAIWSCLSLSLPSTQLAPRSMTIHHDSPRWPVAVTVRARSRSRWRRPVLSGEDEGYGLWICSDFCQAKSIFRNFGSKSLDVQEFSRHGLMFMQICRFSRVFEANQKVFKIFIYLVDGESLTLYWDVRW